MIRRRKPVRRVSANKAKSDRLFAKIANEYLAKPENQFCRAAEVMKRDKIVASEVHHIRGRIGTLKFDTRFFCPTYWWNHRFIHNNPDWSKRYGLLGGAGEWGYAPKDEETARIKSWMQEQGIW